MGYYQYLVKFILGCKLIDWFVVWLNKGLKHKEMQELTSYIYCKERLLKYNNIKYIIQLCTICERQHDGLHDLLNTRRVRECLYAARAPLHIPRHLDSSWNLAITGSVVSLATGSHTSALQEWRQLYTYKKYNYTYTAFIQYNASNNIITIYLVSGLNLESYTIFKYT